MNELAWQKSSYSASGSECVEVAAGEGGVIHLRESDRPDQIITTTSAKLAAFIKGVKAGEFDRFTG
jgi:hypothetical protein